MRANTSLEDSGRLKGNRIAKSGVVFIFTLLLLGAPGAPGSAPAPVTLANPMQGTDSEFGYSHGNEYPAIALPFPMNTWAPYTQPARDSFYYQ
jgi:putative alpha-1,2-mannosidase